MSSTQRGAVENVPGHGSVGVRFAFLVGGKTDCPFEWRGPSSLDSVLIGTPAVKDNSASARIVVLYLTGRIIQGLKCSVRFEAFPEALGFPKA